MDHQENQAHQERGGRRDHPDHTVTQDDQVHLDLRGRRVTPDSHPENLLKGKREILELLVLSGYLVSRVERGNEAIQDRLVFQENQGNLDLMDMLVPKVILAGRVYQVP